MGNRTGPRRLAYALTFVIAFAGLSRTWGQYPSPLPFAPAQPTYNAPVYQGPWDPRLYPEASPPPNSIGAPPNPVAPMGAPSFPGPAPEALFSPPPPEITPAEELAPLDESLPSGELPPPTPEYTFFDLGYWFPTDGWSNSFEIGINGSTGNADSFSIRTGAHLQRTVDASTFTFDVKYAKTLSHGFETQHNALLNSNVESDLGDSPFTSFLKTSLEYDEYKAFDLRTAINVGVGLYLLKAEDAKFIVRFGSGVSRELGGPDDRYVPEAVYGLEFDRRLTKRQKLYATFDYFPDWTDYSDYRLVTNAGWEFVLDQESNLSLKLGAIDRYDSTPHGRKPNDLDYSLLLLWKQ